MNNGIVVLDELDAVGAVTKTMVRGLNAIAEIDAAGNIQFMHTDALGSTIMITDNAGAVVGRYEYDAFGQIVGADGTAESKYLFTGQEFDPESELTYMNARYYNADLGRFISRDPMMGRVGDLVSRNGYVYVKNNPLKYVDPTGETEEHGLWGAITGFLGQTVSSFNNLNAGIIDAFSSNLSWGATDLVFYNNGFGTSYDVGRVIGSGASIIQGSFEFVGGFLLATGGTGGGAALCVVTAGGGCIAGVGVAAGSIVVGAGVATHGGGMILHAVSGDGGRYPSQLEPDQTGERYNIVKTNDGKFRYFVNGERRTPPKALDFILKDGRLQFGENHSFLSGNGGVDYAGEVQFSGDYTSIKSWTNNSGHYQPSGNDTVGIEMVKDAFRNQFGVELPSMSPIK